MSHHKLLQTAVLSAFLCGSLAAQGPCSRETVRGVWAYWTGISTLTAVPPGGTQAVPLPAAMLGVVTVDAEGAASGWINAMTAGRYSDLSLRGTLDVLPDCTATLRFALTPSGASTPLRGEGVTRLFIADNGKELRGMTVSGVLGNFTGTETWRRMASGNSAPKCTYQNVRGLYGTTGQGAAIQVMSGQLVGVPWSQTGRFVIDTTGETAGTSWMSFAGQPVELKVAAKLELSEDCTGYFVYMGGIDKVIVLDDGDQILDLQLQGQGHVLPAVWKRIVKDTTPQSQ